MSKAASNPKVSVVITTHNRAALLPRAIRSVLAQTYENYELIVVDDCSTDDTPDVIRTFVDSRIRVVRHADNMGQSAAINTGIRLARGEYIAFLDDDDEWVETKLLRQVRTLDASDPRVGLVYTWFDYVDVANGVRRAGGRSVMSGDISEDILGWDLPAPTSAYLVRAKAARGIGGFDETLAVANDLDFVARLSMQWHGAGVRDVLMLMHEGRHVRSAQRPGAPDRVESLKSFMRRFERELVERPSTFARLLRVLAIAEMKCGNMRGAARAYSKALTVDTLGTLRATIRNVDSIGALLWGRVRRTWRWNP